MLKVKYNKLIEKSNTVEDFKKIIRGYIDDKYKLTQRQLQEVIDYKNGVKVKNAK
jgi:hypothetical protein